MRARIAGLLRAAAVAAAVMAAAAVALSWIFIDWNEEGSGEYPGGAILRDSTGEMLRVSLGRGDVDCRPCYEAAPEDWIAKAVVAVEDGEFWRHCGVRPLSMLRALFQNVFNRRRISGASTITMQTVRLIRPHRKSYWRKWVEAFEAMKMERRRTKTWILSQYLNRAPFGSNFVGIEAAANGWFGKGAKDLGLGEAAMLAAMVQAPSRFRPDRGYAAAFKRREYVLERMLRLGFIDRDQLEGARSVVPAVRRAPRPFKAPYYCDFVMRELGLDRAAQRRCGDFLTPLDPDVQALCERAVNAAAREGGYSVAAVVMRPQGGETIALACSGDYFDPEGGQVNTALAMRPAGSTLKPFLAALALDTGAATPEQRLDDAPMARKGYRPANFDSSYRGRVTLRDALVLSLNIPFVQLLEKVGLERFADTLRALGFSGLDAPPERFGLGMAIGNVEVSLVELVRAYAGLAACAGGGGAERGADGETAGSGGGVEARGAAAPVFSRAACHLVSEMLSGGERSGAAVGHIADVRMPRFAWKTGTSAAYRDAWTVAWNPEYAIGVWCGHKRGGFGDTSLVGAKAAAPVAWTIARALYPQGDGPWFAEPEDIGRRRICATTGLPAGPACQTTEEGRYLKGRSFATPCGACASPRGAGADMARLQFIKPEDGAVFALVSAAPKQKIVFEVSGAPPDGPLWWFVDGLPLERTPPGVSRISLDPEPGRHVATCVRLDGATASVEYEVGD